MPPVPPPPRPRAPKVLLVTSVVVAALMFVGLPVAAGALAWKSSTNSPAAVVQAAAYDVGAAPALRLDVSYVAADGRTTTGKFTVTAGQYASGTITDPVAGTAEFRADPRTSVVRGDVDWWANRATDDAPVLANKWIRPDDGVAIGVPVATAFHPAALAKLVRELGGRAPRAPTPITFNGRQALEITSGDWTMLLAADRPHRVLALAGPVGSGTFRPAVADAPGQIVRADNAVPAPPGILQVRAPADDGYLHVTSESGDEGDAAKTRRDVGKALPQGPSAGPSSSAEPEPPAQRDVSNPQPDLSTRIVAPPRCSTPTCDVDAPVTNDGDAACDNAGVNISAVGAGQQQNITLGEIPAGGKKNAHASFVNPAQPGQTIPVNLIATPFCASLVKPDPKVDERLRARGIDPNNSPQLRKMPADDQPWARKVLDLMTQGLADHDKNNNYALRALEKAKRQGELWNYVKYLADHQERVIGWEDLPAVLHKAPNDIGVRSNVKHGVARLLDDPEARVAIDTRYPDPASGKVFQGDNLDPSNREAVEIKVVTTSNENTLQHVLRKAISQLNNQEKTNKGVDGYTPPGWRRTVILEITPKAGVKLYEATIESLTEIMRGQRFWAELCKDGKPRVDKLVIENKTGAHTWTSAQFRDFAGDACP